MNGKITELLKSEKAGKILFFVGIAGIALIFMSSLFSGSSKESSTANTSSSDYADEMEKKITNIVEGITGNSNIRVLVTLESEAEYIYAQEANQTTDTTEDSKSSDEYKTQKKDSTQNQYITIDSADGGESPLVVTQLSPTVKGVVVVAQGVDNNEISERIKEAVTTALDISPKRVCVTGSIS